MSFEVNQRSCKSLCLSVRLVTSIVLLVDISPGNWIARSCNYFSLNFRVTLLPEMNSCHLVVYEISWSFGLAGITLYLIGIGQTISQVRGVYF